MPAEEQNDGDWYRECRERAKERHHGWLEHVSPIVQKKLRQLADGGHTVEMKTEWHYRIDGRWDIFWQSKRYHDIKTNTRGDYRDIMQFMHSFKP